ncbi:helix-turn-helix transcriptional regulator [Nocardia sp. AG03]|uniref:helix-turn-helix transcriptional regulator n=1 Tax=Nocardia sp. AG03 TaxID=3025312 RepID=UPI002418AF3E|nr:helix-turn-helix transcriptional regulator [Nocardia sp. AG03]
MTLVDTRAHDLEEVLAGLRWRFAGRDELVLTAGGWAHPAGEASALIVLDGLIRVEGLAASEDLACGDFLFVPGTHRCAVQALADSTVLHVRLTPAATGAAMAALPERVLLTDFVQHSPLAATMFRHLVQECADPFGVQGDRVATLIATMAVQTWHTLGCAPKRWLLRVDEPGLAAAVAAMHAEPGRDWTVEALARVALASRSGFAARFQSATGRTPGRYLTELRMDRAQHALTDTDTSIATVARRLGYTSETAFARAFRRHTGRTPSQWRRETGPNQPEE